MASVKKRIEFEPISCPECNGSVIDSEERGELTCSGCGLVLSDKRTLRDTNYPIFSFKQKEKMDTGEFHKAANKGFALGSTFLIRECDPGKRHEYKFLKQPSRDRSSDERAFNGVYQQIILIGSAMDLYRPIVREALDLLAIIHPQREALNLKRRSYDTIACSIIFLVSRMNDYPISFSELRTHATEGSLILQYYERIASNLKINVDITLSYAGYISRICSQLTLSFEIERVANKLINSLQRIKGCAPSKLAAGAIYYACRLKKEYRTQKEIADIAECTESTVRNDYHYLRKQLESRIRVQ